MGEGAPRKPGYHVGTTLGVIGGVLAIPAAIGACLFNLGIQVLPHAAIDWLLLPGFLLLLAGVLVRRWCR
jgi:hypothetical protein